MIAKIGAAPLVGLDQFLYGAAQQWLAAERHPRPVIRAWPPLRALGPIIPLTEYSSEGMIKYMHRGPDG